MASIQPLVLILHFFWLLQQLLKKLPTRVVVKDAAGTVLHEERYTSDVLDRCIDLWEDADGAGSQAPSRRWTVYDGDNPWANFAGDGSLTMRYLYELVID
jgi:hypothetical protein